MDFKILNREGSSTHLIEQTNRDSSQLHQHYKQMLNLNFYKDYKMLILYQMKVFFAKHNGC